MEETWLLESIIRLYSSVPNPILIYRSLIVSGLYSAYDGGAR